MARRMDTRTLMICAALGVAGGLLLVPVNYASQALFVAVPLAGIALTGVWIFPPLLASSLLAAPGVGLLTSTIAGLVSVPLTPFGWLALVQGVLFGVVAELVFALLRYRHFDAVVVVASGAVGCLLVAGATYASYGLGQLSVPVQILSIAVQPLSGAVFGLLAHLLSRRLSAAGVGAVSRRNRSRPTAA